MASSVFRSFYSSSLFKHISRQTTFHAQKRNIQVTYIDKEGHPSVVDGKEDENLLYLAHRCSIELEGACEASLACSTCHVYVETPQHWDLLPEPTEEEDDMLDQAKFLKENSRLGCQIVLKPNLDGLIVRLPKATRNFYVDGHTPQPH